MLSRILIARNPCDNGIFDTITLEEGFKHVYGRLEKSSKLLG